MDRTARASEEEKGSLLAGADVPSYTEEKKAPELAAPTEVSPAPTPANGGDAAEAKIELSKLSGGGGSGGGTEKSPRATPGNHPRQRTNLGRLPGQMPKSKFDTYEALNGMPSMSIVKTSEKFKEAKQDHRHGDHHVQHHARWERWATNAAIGLVCGLTSFFLKMVVQFLSNARNSMILAESDGDRAHGDGFAVWAWASAIIMSSALLTASAAIIIYVEPNAAGSGIPETCAFLNGVIIPKTFSVSVLFAKFASCGLAVGAGIPVGPEGPMIHMGSVIGSIISQGVCLPAALADRLKMFRNVGDRRDFMAAGVAGGVSAAFSAPIGGLLFVAEEVASHWDVNLGMQVFLCAVVSCTTVELLTSSFEGFVFKAPFGMIQVPRRL